MVFIFRERLSLVLVTVRGPGADTDVGDSCESTNGSYCLGWWQCEWQETPAGFGDACSATAEVNTDSRVGVTDNVQNTGCAGSISGDNAEMMGVVLTVTVIVVLTVLVAMQIIVLGISEDASSGSGNSAGHTVSASHHYCCL